MTKDLTVRELYKMLGRIVEELGECPVEVRYDGGTTVTPIKNRLPYLRINRHTLERTIELEGY